MTTWKGVIILNKNLVIHVRMMDIGNIMMGSLNANL